jgi:hypothetical protein
MSTGLPKRHGISLCASNATSPAGVKLTVNNANARKSIQPLTIFTKAAIVTDYLRAFVLFVSFGSKAVSSGRN